MEASSSLELFPLFMSAPKHETVIADKLKYTRGVDPCQANLLRFSVQAFVPFARPIVSRCFDRIPQRLI
jgi:hypothetical protein